MSIKKEKTEDRKTEDETDNEESEDDDVVLLRASSRRKRQRSSILVSSDDDEGEESGRDQGAGEGGRQPLDLLLESQVSSLSSSQYSVPSDHECPIWVDYGEGKKRCGERIPWVNQTCAQHQYGGSISSPSQSPAEAASPVALAREDDLPKRKFQSKITSFF